MDLIGCCIDFIYFLNVIPRIIFVDHTRDGDERVYTHVVSRRLNLNFMLGSTNHLGLEKDIFLKKKKLG